MTFKRVNRLRGPLTGGGRTGPDGRFHFTWHPGAAGSYQVLARIPDPGRGLLPDRACPKLVNVLPKR